MCVSSCVPSTGDLALNPGMCPDWESNQQPFGSQASAQSTEPHQPGLIFNFISKSCLYTKKIGPLSCVTHVFCNLSFNFVAYFCEQKFKYIAYFYIHFIYLFSFRDRGMNGKRVRNINVWLPLECPLLGTWPATQAGPLTGN